MLVAALWIVLQSEEIVCEGAYPQHLQGVARDSAGDLYWSFTTTLVKTDGAGRLITKIDVESHHGDVCVVGDRLYCALNKGQFNSPQGKSDNWIVVYDTSDLREVGRKQAMIVIHGAGGIASDGERLIVVGGLPTGVQENYVYEFDLYLNFVRRYVLDSGWTLLGVQTAAFADGRWWFGCYGSPAQLLSTGPELGNLSHSQFDCSLGLVPLGGGRFLVGRDKAVEGEGHVGSLMPARGSRDGKLRLIHGQVQNDD